MNYRSRHLATSGRLADTPSAAMLRAPTKSASPTKPQELTETGLSHSEQFVREFRPERDYSDFLLSKVPVTPSSGVEPGELHGSLLPFHKAIVRWAVRRGRCAIFANTGLWKTSMQIEWIRQFDGPGLIVAPLGVAAQTIARGEFLGVVIKQVSDVSGSRRGPAHHQLRKAA
jgi:hypothetical protein